MSAIVELAKAFAREQPDRVTTLVETAPMSELAAFLEFLEPAVAARIVARSVPTAAATALSELAEPRAARILVLQNPRIAALLLRRVEEKLAKRLLAAMSGRERSRIESIMRYRDDQIASRVDARSPAVPRHSTVEHALAVVRQSPGGALHYVYVVDDDQRLVGVCTMRELMCAEAQTRVSDLMVESPERLVADDPLDSVVVHPGWRRVHALPVVDPSGRYIGAIRYSEFRRLEAETGRSLGSAQGSQAAGALAELFSIGAAALFRMGETAVVGGRTERGGGR